VRYWQELGKEGKFSVFKYKLVRRAGQPEVLSKQVRRGATGAPGRARE
jgi:hypothetical protein